MVAPTANGAAAADYGNFKMVQSFDLEYAPVKLSKWRSDKTGLTVTLGSHPCEWSSSSSSCNSLAAVMTTLS